MSSSSSLTPIVRLTMPIIKRYIVHRRLLYPTITLRPRVPGPGRLQVLEIRFIGTGDISTIEHTDFEFFYFRMIRLFSAR